MARTKKLIGDQEAMISRCLSRKLFPFVITPAFAALLAGCGSANDPDPTAPIPTATTPPVAPQKPVTSGEAVIPSTGQTVDTKQAVDVVKAEVNGGEADAKGGPTPVEFLEQEADESLISDQPFEIVAPLGLSPVASYLPAYNPPTVGKVELGKQLYYDQRVSADATVSCASCHDPAKGWTDNRVTSVGIGNQLGARNAPTVLNTVYGKSMFWDGRAPSLEGQAQGPIQNKIEMGDQSYGQIIARLRTIPGYRDQFRRVFGTDVTLDGMAKAVATFERTALSGGSAYDQYVEGDPRDKEDEEWTHRTFGKLTLAEKRGMVLFGLGSSLKQEDPDFAKLDVRKLNGRANCTACHSGANFSDEMFHNLGVGFDEAKATHADLGRWPVAPIGAKSKAERGAFKTPTVRDITRTAPYMHDGSEATLEAVVEFYNKGGTRNPTLDPKMAPLNLTDQEKADLVAFMKALTGQVITVTVPTLPPGPDGTAPDPRSALNAPGASQQAATRVHRVLDEPPGVIGLR